MNMFEITAVCDVDFKRAQAMKVRIDPQYIVTVNIGNL